MASIPLNGFSCYRYGFLTLQNWELTTPHFGQNRAEQSCMYKEVQTTPIDIGKLKFLHLELFAKQSDSAYSTFLKTIAAWAQPI